MSSPPSLPLKIWEHIIDIVGSRSWDSATINSLCLTCKDFVPRSRHHIYKEIRLSIDDNGYIPQYYPLKSSLQRSPHLLKYVKSLVLLDNPTNRRLLTLINRQNFLAGLFDFLRNHIKSFHLRLIHFTEDSNCSWEKIPYNVQLALSKFFFQSSITALRIDYLDDIPASFAPLLATIPNVHLTDVSFKDGPPSKAVRQFCNLKQNTKSKKKLKNLTLQTMRQPNSIQPLVDVMSIEALTYTYIDDSDMSFDPAKFNSYDATNVAHKIFRSSAASLKRLEWNVSKAALTAHAPEQFVNLKILSNLSSIKLTADLISKGPHASQDMTVFDKILQMLKTVSSPNKITKLEFSFANLTFWEAKKDKKPRFKEPQWAQLDKLFTGPLFGHLQSVHFALESPHVGGNWNARESVEDGLRRMFPLSHARGLIRQENVKVSAPLYFRVQPHGDDEVIRWIGSEERDTGEEPRMSYYNEKWGKQIIRWAGGEGVGSEERFMSCYNGIG